MVESHVLPGDTDWTRLVLPTEGYMVEVPTSWKMMGITTAGGSRLSATSTSGAWVSISRFADPVGLLALTESRIRELRGLPGETPPIETELFMEMDLPVPRAILIYKDADRTVHEYLTVRGAVGKEGIAYSTVFSSEGSPDLAEIRKRVADSLTLLGLTPP